MNHTTAGSTVIRRKTNHHHHQSLIPGLPDHIAQICLSHVHPRILYSICRSWRRFAYSPSFPPFLSIYALLLPSRAKPETTQLGDSVEFASFDPISSNWQFLPPPPDAPLRLLVRHPAFISRHLPIQSVSVSGNLVLLAATADHFVPAISSPLVFNPIHRKWTYGPPLATPRRWCAAGASRGVVYVASGIGFHYNPDIARSVEKWDLESNSICYCNGNGNHDDNCNHRIRIGFDSDSDSDSNRIERAERKIINWKWEGIGGMRDGKFSREAIEAVGWRGKLCMVNVKGDAAKEGIIYDVESDTWHEMPEGMLMGWRGPAEAMAEEDIYMVDESKGELRMYDSESDIWVDIVESETLKSAQHVAAAGGRVCVVHGGGSGITVVDVVARPPRLVVVESPVGFQVLNIHILPRMSQVDFQSIEGEDDY